MIVCKTHPQTKAKSSIQTKAFYYKAYIDIAFTETELCFPHY